MIRHIRLLVICVAVAAAAVVAVLTALLAVFYSRPPVLIVTEEPFVVLYGAARLKKEQSAAARALFRQVKPVMVADGISPDMVIFAIIAAEPRPWCVLFPRSQALAAPLFHEQFPEIPAVVLSGLVTTTELPPPDGIFCVYGTDRELDMYRAGLCAGILGIAGRKTAAQTAAAPKTYVFWQDNYTPQAGRDLFSRGIRERHPESNAIFINIATQLPDSKEIAGVTLTGAGAEYLERKETVPVILFSWMNPDVLPVEIIVQFDDSVWALAAPAVRLAMKGQVEGKIPSKPLIFSRKIADNDIFRMLEKSAKKTP